MMKTKEQEKAEAEAKLRAVQIAQVCTVMQNWKSISFEYNGEYLFIDEEKIHVNEWLNKSDIVPFLFDHVPDLVVEAMQEMAVLIRHIDASDFVRDPIRWNAKLIETLSGLMFKKEREWPTSVPIYIKHEVNDV